MGTQIAFSGLSKEATFARTCPSARLVSRNRGVAINELVLAQGHELAGLSVQTSKSPVVLGSSRDSPHTRRRPVTDAAKRCPSVLVCADRGNPLHNFVGWRPVNRNLVVREIGEVAERLVLERENSNTGNANCLDVS